MLSRVAESIYWMCRYVERAENVARVIDVNLRLMLDQPAGTREQWEPLVSVTGDLERFAKRYSKATRANVIQFLTFETENPNSILSCLRAARENARTVREAISSEMWEELNKFYIMVSEAATTKNALETPHEFFTQVKNCSHLFIGINLTTMSHGEEWHFCRLGRMLERADQTSRIVDVKYFILLPEGHEVGTPLDEIHWAALLKSASALEMYRKQYGRLSPDQIVEFLLLDREFPRAVQYCLRRVQDSLHAISGSPIDTFRNSADRRCGQMCAALSYSQITDIIAGGLHEYVDSLQLQINELGQAIHDVFFAMRQISPPQMPAVLRQAQ